MVHCGATCLRVGDALHISRWQCKIRRMMVVLDIAEIDATLVYDGHGASCATCAIPWELYVMAHDSLAH